MTKAAIIALTALSVPAAAHAFGSTAGPLSTPCKLPGLYTDGCAGAPTANPYTVQHSDMLTSYALQSGQTYSAAALAARTQNMPAVEYPVGVNANKIGAFGVPGGASDVTVSANWNAINNATGGSGGTGGANCRYFGPTRHYVVCNGTTTTGTLTIDGFDFSAAGNSTGAMSLEIQSTVQVPCVISNNNFKFDLNSYQITLYPIKITGCTSLTLSNNIISVDTPAAWLGPLGNVAPTNNMYVAWQNLTPTGPLTTRYNAFIGCPTRCIGNAQNSTIDIANDYYEGIKVYSIAAPAAHGDGVLSSFNNSTQALFSMHHTTWMQPAYGGISITGQATLVTNNPLGDVFISTTAGNSVVTQTSGITLTQNYYLKGVSVTGPNAWKIVGDGTTPANPPSAAPTTITMDQPANLNGTSVKYTEMLPATVTLTDIQNNIFISNNTSAASPDGAGLASMSYLIWAQYANYQTMRIKNNLIDPHGSVYCFGALGYGIDPSPQWGGNINLNDNSSWNQFDTTAGSCPGSRPS